MYAVYIKQGCVRGQNFNQGGENIHSFFFLSPAKGNQTVRGDYLLFANYVMQEKLPQK